MHEDAAVLGFARALAPGEQPPAKLGGQVVVCIGFFCDEGPPVLTADANGGRAIHLIHDAENLVGILILVVHEPCVEIAQVLPVEKPNRFTRGDGAVFGTSGKHREGENCIQKDGQSELTHT